MSSEVARRSRPWVGAGALALAAACAPPAYLRAPGPVPAVYPAPRIDAVVGAADTVAGHLVEPVRLRAANGLTVDLLLKRPVPTAAAPRAPLVLLLGGHHAGREAAHYIPDTRGHAVAALSYPYRGAHRPSAFGLVRAAPRIRRAVHDTPPAVRLALDWLAAQPWADASRVEGVGASLGVPFMTVAAALDPRITRLWAVHGAGDNVRLLSHNTRKYVGWKPARSVVVHAASALVSARAFSADRWVARVAPRPVVLVNATDDERLPRAAVAALHAAAREPKEVVWLPGQHVQRSRPEVLRALVATVLARMAPDDTAAPTSER